MNKRLRGTIGLAINYTVQIVIVLIIAEGFKYFFEEIASVPLLIGMVLLVNTVTLKHMRSYWMDIIVGDIKAYSDHRPGFTDEILDEPPTKPSKLDVNNDLNKLLKAATKVKTKDHSDLMRNPLDD